MRICQFLRDKNNPNRLRIKVGRAFIGKVEDNNIYFFKKQDFYLICPLTEEIVHRLKNLSLEI